MNDKYYMAALGLINGVGNKTLDKLIKFFGSAQLSWLAKDNDVVRAGLRGKTLEAFIYFRKHNSDKPEMLREYCEREKIKLCSIFEEEYPPILKQIDSPPMFFYYRGNLKPQAKRIAIVGSRNNTDYGQNVALELGEQLAVAGLTVVSGAARGIDTFAHQGALKTGRTVAVLGCGLNAPLPSDKKNFLEQIAERGAVISEYAPTMPAGAATLLARNRIIAGLSLGVVVVEAAQKGGSVVTCNYAKKYGRKLFAVPGQIFAAQSAGCNNLIRGGATLIRNAADILEHYEKDSNN